MKKSDTADESLGPTKTSHPLSSSISPLNGAESPGIIKVLVLTFSSIPDSLMRSATDLPDC